MELAIFIIAIIIIGAIPPVMAIVAMRRDRKKFKPYPGPEVIAKMRESRKRWMQLEQSSMQSWELLCQCPERKTQEQIDTDIMREYYEYLMSRGHTTPRPPSSFGDYLNAISDRSLYEPYFRVRSSIYPTDHFRRL